VQGLLSLQRVAASAQSAHPAGSMHEPEEQTTAVCAQTPLTHASVVQAKLSLVHAVPSATAELVQTPVAVLHESVVQGLLSLQRVAASKHGGIPIMLKLALKPMNGPSTIP
jgi:hypothetical protein